MRSYRLYVTLLGEVPVRNMGWEFVAGALAGLEFLVFIVRMYIIVIYCVDIITN